MNQLKTANKTSKTQENAHLLPGGGAAVGGPRMRPQFLDRRYVRKNFGQRLCVGSLHVQRIATAML